MWEAIMDRARDFYRFLEKMDDRLRNAVIIVVVVTLVHTVYYLVIRPSAERAIEVARLAGESAPRNFVVLFKDWEQEFCVILGLCCFGMIGYKIAGVFYRKRMYKVDFLREKESQKVEGETDKEVLSAVVARALDTYEKLERFDKTPLVNTLKSSFRRYQITHDVQNTSDAVNASIEAEGMHMEADNAMIRYMIWAIPSIGFIGTVRGIGRALSEADEALAGDIASMTANLGIAFNSTFVALIVSIILMLLLHFLQQLQDGSWSISGNIAKRSY